MEISIVRKIASDLTRSLNTVEWSNRLDTLGIKLFLTDGPTDHYPYGIQLRYEGRNPNLYQSPNSTPDLKVGIHIIPDMEVSESTVYGILKGDRHDYCRSEDWNNWLQFVYQMEKDLMEEIQAAFGHEASYP